METNGHPVVYAEWLGAPGQPTLLVYGHYDVQPADPLDRWRSAPFDRRPYAMGGSTRAAPATTRGRCSSPCKVAEAFFATDGRLPLNVKLLLEGEEEIGSPHLEAFVAQHASRLAADYALSADGAMWRIDRAVDYRGQPRYSSPLTSRYAGRAPTCTRAATAAPYRTRCTRWPTLVAGLHRSDGAVAVAGFYDARPPSER